MRTLATLIIVFAAALGLSSLRAAVPSTTSELDTQAQANAVADALQSVAAVKQAVAGFRVTHDAFPGSNAEAGVKAPAMYASNTVKGVSVGPGGIIDLQLTAASGVDDGVIRFRPDFVPQSGAGDVHWVCTSASYVNVSDLTGGTCEHTSQP